MSLETTSVEASKVEQEHDTMTDSNSGNYTEPERWKVVVEPYSGFLGLTMLEIIHNIQHDIQYNLSGSLSESMRKLVGLEGISIARNTISDLKQREREQVAQEPLEQAPEPVPVPVPEPLAQEPVAQAQAQAQEALETVENPAHSSSLTEPLLR